LSNRWNRFRREVLTERGAICEVCLTVRPHPTIDMEPSQMHLHHVRPKRLYPTLRYDKQNIVVCCHPCHYLLEGGHVQPPAEYYQHE
jgi:5-methylcytosine-specific restriction endonuclease McrA